MGVQTFMTGGSKTLVTASALVSGGLILPSLEDISIFTILDTADLHRLKEIQLCIGYCLDFARDNNVYEQLVAEAVITTLDAGKAGVIEQPLLPNVVTGHVGFVMNTAVRRKGDTNIIDNEHHRLLQWMNENDRLAS